MPYFVYILQSKATGRYYCGSSSDVTKRLNQHNDPQYTGSKTTKRFQGPWKLVYTDEFGTRSKAMIGERRIKKRGISRFLETLNRSGRPARKKVYNKE